MPHFSIPELADGVYERVLTDRAASLIEALRSSGRAAQADRLEEPEEASQHLARAIYEALAIALPELTVEKQLGLANDLLNRVASAAPGAFLREELRLRPELLRAIGSKGPLGGDPIFATSPSGSLSQSELLVNAKGRSVVAEILSEIDSADEIDLLMSFIRWSGFVKFREALRRHCEVRRRPLRVLTTIYMGATEARAIAELQALGAQIKVSFDDQTTRLHAKAWLFRRRSGYHTAYIGSSNLSKSAMTDGIEWNVRLTQADNAQIIDTFSQVFDTYWNDDSSFESYRVEDRGRLMEALARANKRHPESEDSLPLVLDVRPHDFQKVILEELEAAREAGKTRNLVVAATGTGKTVVAALDYRRLRDAGHVDSLLFVAHREEILKQSRALFRHVMRNSAFGELLNQYESPREGRHVFASIQSLGRVLSSGGIKRDAFDMVIVDEVHHAAAKSYQELLKAVGPKILLGLTATPERADGMQLEGWPEITTELRVWDAIDRQILVPFNYFALDDGTDLSSVPWKRGRYVESDLSVKLRGAEHIWVDRVVRAIAENVRDHSSMKALAFCVDIEHARFVAERLSRKGIRAEALTSDSDRQSRVTAIERLRSGGVNVLCTVDLFNEGVDIPEVDTVIFLRPTESATVFLQQLGRGLRRYDGKDCLTVLDFIGKQYERFRFDLRYRALLGVDRKELEHGIKHGFRRLPSGCSLQFDQVAGAEVLRCVRHALPSTKKAMLNELKSQGASVSLRDFLHSTGLSLSDVYRGGRSWTSLRADAGFGSLEDGDERSALERVQGLIHADDPDRLRVWKQLIADPGASLGTERERRLARMLFVVLYGFEIGGDLTSALGRWKGDVRLRAEIAELANVLSASSQPAHRRVGLSQEIPLHGHSRYTTDELVTAFDLRSDKGKLYRPVPGVVWVEKSRHDLLLVTLDKSAKSKLPHLQYRDYAITETLFHWESQAGTAAASPTGRRHVQPEAERVTPVLFVRRRPFDERGAAEPYYLLGPVKYVRHEGERPIGITWQLETPMPAALLQDARIASA